VGWLRETLARLGGGAPAPAPAPAAAAAAPSADWRKQGNEALAAGNLAEATRCYQQGVAEQPGDAALRLNLGFALLEQGQFDEAAQRLEQAIALRRPGDGCAAHEVHYLLGRARVGMGDLEKAFTSFDAATRAQPEFTQPLAEGARVLHQLKRHEEAVDWARRLVRVQPDSPHRILLATELAQCARHEEALEVVGQVCAEEPANVEAASLRFGELMKLQRLVDALQEIDRVLALTEPTADLLVNRSLPLERLGRHEEALHATSQALALQPNRRDALVNRATILLAQARAKEAKAAAEQGLAAYPDDADLHWSLSMALLLLGDLRRGWAESEWRSRSVAFTGKLLELDHPRWQGESLEGCTIFLHAEQGFGDNIQFVRFVPQIAKLAKSVLLLVSQALEPLVAGSLPTNCRLLPQHSVLPPIDFHCPLMSLPAILGTTVDTIPADVPYLHADPAAVEAWRQRLGPGSPKVGVAWSGNPRHMNDQNRSMSLATFRAGAAEGCRYFTVQPETRDTDREALANWTQASDIGAELRDFADTAALMEALDLVITVDTSVAHLAGALGRPVWILLPYAPDWRWMLDRTDTPWYPTARLYRQTVRGDWASVLARVKSDLTALAAPR
jgi:tetratricopeptide (TPR) repeat protein